MFVKINNDQDNIEETSQTAKGLQSFSQTLVHKNSSYFIFTPSSSAYIPPMDGYRQLNIIKLFLAYNYLYHVCCHSTYIFSFCIIQPMGQRKQSKTNTNYLPKTYQQFLAVKKKNSALTSKALSMVAKVLAVPTNTTPNLSYFHQQIPKQLRKTNQIKVFDDNEQEIAPSTANISEKIVYSDYQEMFNQFENCKFDAIADKIRKEIQKLKEQTPTRSISVNHILKDLSIQSLENLRNLEKELKVMPGRRNVEKIDTMLNFNKFFLILNREKRFKIYDNCQFITVQQGQQIYKQGEVEDFMYVVIKGCVRQHEKKSTSYHEKITVNFISHYQGSNFGEAQLVGQKNQKAKRHHTAISSQKTYLLKIDNQFYRDLITNSAEDDFQKKISSLLSTSIFSQTSKIFVTPLLSTLEKRTLNFGEVLIRQGEPVRKLYFIGEGNLQVVYVSRDRRSTKHLIIQQKPKDFKTRGNFSQQKQRQKNVSIHKSFYYSKQQQKDTNKQFIYGKKKIIGDQLQYNDQIVFQQLRSGNFLGGKSFLSQQQLCQKCQKSQFLEQSLQAKLTVIASSIFTTVYSIDQKKFFSLSDNLQKVIIDGIIGSPYFDEKNIEVKVTAHQEWKKYSQGLVAKVIKEKKERNLSFRN